MKTPARPERPDRATNPFVSVIEHVEANGSLDTLADRLTPLVQPFVSSSRLRGVLRGRWLGHALHPLLTDFPLGAWTCTSLLDLFGGRRSRPAAEGLLAFGLATAVPTVLTGAAEWTLTSGRERRVGVVHAGINTAALSLYTASLITRRRHHHTLAVGLGVAGGITATIGGYFGGHLTLARKVGTADPTFTDARTFPSGAAR
jgi:uncharacterized membrane protein